MFRGPSFIVSTMQEETTPIFKRLWYDWTQQQLGIEPTNPLGQCWVPPIVALYDQQGLMRTYSLPGAPSGAPTPDPHGGSNGESRKCENANTAMRPRDYTLGVFSVIYILSVGRIHSNCDWGKKGFYALFPIVCIGSGLKNKDQS